MRSLGCRSNLKQVGAILLNLHCRWIYDNKAIFKGMNVLGILSFVNLHPELGSGCGLPGIVIARYAKEVILTDYLPQVHFVLVSNLLLDIRKSSIQCKTQ